jgi:four helix bundle protein
LRLCIESGRCDSHDGLVHQPVARGSASELEYQLLLARDLKFLPPGDYEQLSQQTIEIKRMLKVLVRVFCETGRCDVISFLCEFW